MNSKPFCIVGPLAFLLFLMATPKAYSQGPMVTDAPFSFWNATDNDLSFEVVAVLQANGTIRNINVIYHVNAGACNWLGFGKDEKVQGVAILYLASTRGGEHITRWDQNFNGVKSHDGYYQIHFGKERLNQHQQTPNQKFAANLRGIPTAADWHRGFLQAINPGTVVAKKAVVQAPPAVEQKALTRAHTFLAGTQTGKLVCGYVHFGAQYTGHAYREWRAIPGQPGGFEVTYRYTWEDDGITDIVFRCDSSGTVYDVQVPYSNAQWQRPFAMAKLSMQTVGRLIVEAFRDQLTPEDLAQLDRDIRAANVQPLLMRHVRMMQPR